jgi:phage FluMu gp28-like protein
MKHNSKKYNNKKYGSIATSCRRCGLAFAFQGADTRTAWTGLPCKTTPYTSRELFAINREYVAEVDRWARISAITGTELATQLLQPQSPSNTEREW